MAHKVKVLSFCFFLAEKKLKKSKIKESNKSLIWLPLSILKSQSDDDTIKYGETKRDLQNLDLDWVFPNIL